MRNITIHETAAREAVEAYYKAINGDPDESLETRLWHLLCGIAELSDVEGFDLKHLLNDAMMED